MVILVLSIFLFIMIAAVITLTVLYILKYKKCNSITHLGINFRQPKEKTNIKVLLDTQKIINNLQNKACGAVFSFVSSELEEAIKDIPFKQCDDIQEKIDEEMKDLPEEVDDDLKTLIKNIYSDVIKGLCDKSGNVNTATLIAVVKDLYDSACYKDW